MATRKIGGSAPEKSKSEDSVRSKIINIQSNLETLIGDLRKENTDNSDLQVSTNWILTNISNNIADIAEHVLGMPVIMSNQPKVDPALMAKEKAAEDNKKEEDRRAAMSEIEKVLEDSLKELQALRKDMHKGGFMDILIIGAALLSGFVTGLVTQVMTIFKPVTALFKDGLKFIEPVIELVKTGFAKFVGIFKNMVTLFEESKVGMKLIEGFKGAWSVFSNAWKFITTGFTDIVKIIDTISQMIRTVFSSGQKAVGFFSNFAKYFDELGSIFKLFFNVGSKLGAVIGKLAIPLQVILSIWDTVSGALDGWNKTQGSFMDKFFGALKGGLIGLVDGLIGGLLDFLKDGIAWVLDFFGMKDAADWLNSFSFGEIITDVIGGLVDGFKGIVTGVIDAFIAVKDFFTSIDWNGLIKKGLSWLVVGLTAGANSLTGLFGYDFTKKALDLAGLEDPRGGSTAAAAPATSAPAQGQSTQQLSQVTQSNEAVKTEQQAAAAASSVAAASSSNSSKSNVTNNNATAVMSSKTTSWDPEDMWARGII